MNIEEKENKNKFSKLLSELRSPDEIIKFDAIINLSTELSFAEEATIKGLHLEDFIPELLNCLAKEEMPDMMSKNNHLFNTIYLLVNAAASLDYILDLNINCRGPIVS